MPEILEASIEAASRCRAISPVIWQGARRPELLAAVARTLNLTLYTEDPTQDGLAPKESKNEPKRR